MIRLDSPKRRTGESVVPMINVAFLLLIFFLMVAVVAPPDPLAVTLPEGETGQALTAEADIVLAVSPQGQVLAVDGAPFDPATVTGRAVIIRADASVDASRIARLMSELSAQGAVSLQLAVSPR